MLRISSFCLFALSMISPSYADEDRPYGGPNGGLTALEHCAQTTQGNDVLLDECIADDLVRLDAKLNARYAYLMRTGSNDFAAALRDAQRFWIAYRDSTCTLESGSFRRTIGSSKRADRAACLHRITDDRVEWLNNIKDR